MGLCGTRQRQNTCRSASLNNTRKLNGSITRDLGVPYVKGNTVSFTASATIDDSGSGFGSLVDNRPVLVQGSTLNSRMYLPTSVAAGSLTVIPAQVQTEAGLASNHVRLA